jgi:hypothetical protein
VSSRESEDRCVSGVDGSLDLSDVSLSGEYRRSGGGGEGMQARQTQGMGALHGCSRLTVGALGSSVSCVVGADADCRTGVSHPSNCPPGRDRRGLVLEEWSERSESFIRAGQSPKGLERRGCGAVSRNPKKPCLKDGRRVSAGRTILGSKTYRFCSQGKRSGRGNATAGLWFLLASATHVPSSCVKCSLVPGLNNREVSDVAGVNDQGQISKLMMGRLEGQGLVENTGGDTQGEANAWRMTPCGEEIVSASRVGKEPAGVSSNRGAQRPAGVVGRAATDLVGLARQGFAKSDVSAVEPFEAQVRLDLESEALGLAGFYLVEARAGVSQVGLYVGERAGSLVCSHVGILAHVPGGSGGCFDSTTAAIAVTLTTSLSTVSVRPESSASCLSRRSTSSAAVVSDDVVASATGSAYLSDPAAVEMALGNSLFSPRETMVVAPTNSASTTKPRSSKNTNVELMAMAGNRAGTRAKTVTRVAPITQATATHGRLLSTRDVGPGISLGMSRLSPTVGEDGDNILATDRGFQSEAVLVSMSTVQSLSDTRNALGVGPSTRAELIPSSTPQGSHFDKLQQNALSPQLTVALGVC